MAELIPPDIDDEGLRIIDLFVDISGERQAGGFGLAPLRLVDIANWCELNNYPLAAHELEAVRLIDKILISVVEAANKTKGKKHGGSGRAKS